ncbi:MAG: hypothetical protein J2P36_01820 [Ktedonobacteraceae bacterium]|nr:hypothetical protein [Ktedonobacteraceae bacterium]
MRRRNPTIEQIRALHHFDIPTLAARAGVEVDILYYALLLRPIARDDALKILSALSAHTGLQLSFENVDIPLWEEHCLLWIVRASANRPPNRQGEAEDDYRFVYARSSEHAAALVQHWLAGLPHLPYHYFTPCPDGFRVGDIIVPGHRRKTIMHG